jgi:hypothetical protein
MGKPNMSNQQEVIEQLKSSMASFPHSSHSISARSSASPIFNNRLFCFSEPLCLREFELATAVGQPTILGGLAEFERELIRARTGEGRKRAKDRGVRFGRPRKLSPHQRQEALQRLSEGATCADLGRTYGVDPTTIGRLQA